MAWGSFRPLSQVTAEGGPGEKHPEASPHLRSAPLWRAQQPRLFPQCSEAEAGARSRGAPATQRPCVQPKLARGRGGQWPWAPSSVCASLHSSPDRRPALGAPSPRRPEGNPRSPCWPTVSKRSFSLPRLPSTLEIKSRLCPRPVPPAPLLPCFRHLGPQLLPHSTQPAPGPLHKPSPISSPQMAPTLLQDPAQTSPPQRSPP